MTQGFKPICWVMSAGRKPCHGINDQTGTSFYVHASLPSYLMTRANKSLAGPPHVPRASLRKFLWSPKLWCPESPWCSHPLVGKLDSDYFVPDPGECHDFHLFTYFVLSSKCPNTCSNHDMALSYLIFSYLIFSHFKVTPSRRGKQIVLEYRSRTIYWEEAATTHSFSLHWGQGVMY